MLSDVNGTILKLIVDALYKGYVVLDGKTQLKQFEAATRSLQSFGILLNLRPGVLPGDADDVVCEGQLDRENEKQGDVDTKPEDDQDIDEEEEKPLRSKRSRSLKARTEESESETTPNKKEEEVEEKGRDEDEPLATPTRSSRRSRQTPKSATAADESSTAPTTPEKTTKESRGRKRAKKDRESEANKSSLEDVSIKEEPADDDVEEESPRKRTRSARPKSEDAKKPLFENVTSELLNQKVEQGPVTFIKWLQKEGFLRKTPPACPVAKDCDAKLMLEQDVDNIDGAVWKCKEHRGNTGVSVREGSIFERHYKKGNNSKDNSLSWIIQIILCWSDNTSLHQCQQMTGADIDKIFLWYDECRDYYGTLAE